MFSNKPVKTIELQFDGIYKYFDSNDELHLVMYVRPDSDKKHFIFKKTDGNEFAARNGQAYYEKLIHKKINQLV